MTEQHPITPPPELAAHWVNVIYGKDGFGFDVPLHPITLKLAEQAAQWGADQELEACCEWLNAASYGDTLGSYTAKHVANDLRAARRPKPPSLKEQALEDLEQIDGHAVDQLSAYVIHGDLKRRVSNIRRALEMLPND